MVCQGEGGSTVQSSGTYKHVNCMICLWWGCQHGDNLLMGIFISWGNREVSYSKEVCMSSIFVFLQSHSLVLIFLTVDILLTTCMKSRQNRCSFDSLWVKKSFISSQLATGLDKFRSDFSLFVWDINDQQSK